MLDDRSEVAPLAMSKERVPSKRERLVFISHSSRDTWVARQIAEKIHERGARTFLDANDLRAGYSFARSHPEALQNADELVVLLTPWAVDRFFIAMEIGCAWLKGIPIVQLLYGLSFTHLSQQFQLSRHAHRAPDASSRRLGPLS